MRNGDRGIERGLQENRAGPVDVVEPGELRTGDEGAPIARTVRVEARGYVEVATATAVDPEVIEG